MPERFVCIHGHFYQPPRENPWLEEVERDDSARPFHDWNARVTDECYAPNSASRIMDAQGKIIGVVNNYSTISFNFGPTLLRWIAKEKPDLYRSILEADKEGAKKFSGHGPAIAQAYNHMIMPLSNRRDRETQVKWGIEDFRNRFGRLPEGMWLPETAVDVESLEILAENGITFTILAPRQAAKMRKIGDKDWTDVTGEKIDIRRSYLCRLPSGKTISLFFFDRIISDDLSFGGLLDNGEAFAKRLVDAFKGNMDESPLVNIASDGELYGHHHPHGDMALAYCIHYITENGLAKVTNYAEYLSKHPPAFEVEIKPNTSWSCPHGVERWKSDCGCSLGGKPGWRQTWREPLRNAMDWLRDDLASRFEQRAREYFKDPWAARDGYVEVIIDRSRDNVERFLAKHAARSLNNDEKRLAIKLLEIQRQAMLMYSSDGWFFNEISGNETVQVMMYAARAIQLAREVFGADLEGQYVKMLERAPSNIPEFSNGGRIYDMFIRPAIADLDKIGAHHTIFLLFLDKEGKPLLHEIGCCRVVDREGERREAGKNRLAITRSVISSETTLDEENASCAAIWLGDHNILCGVLRDMKDDAFLAMRNEVVGAFEKGQISETLLLIRKYFEKTYSLKDLFKDDQESILEFIMQEQVRKAIDLYQTVYKDNFATMRFMNEIRVPLPRELRVAASVSLNADILEALSAESVDAESLSQLVSADKSLAIELDLELIGLVASERIVKELSKIKDTTDTKRVENLDKLIRELRGLPAKLNLWSAQNMAFEIAESIYRPAKEGGDEGSKRWAAAFEKLCESLEIKVG